MSRQHQGHTARKRFGQNFLTDTYIIDRIVGAIDPKMGDNLVEIGPGLGALTEAVIPHTDHLHVVELDRDLAQRLEAQPSLRDKLSIHQADALKFDFKSLSISDKKLRVFGNLPYNISTPLIFHLLNYADEIEDMYFMLQKEVVDRMCADRGHKNYGKLTIMTQYFCHVQPVLDVPPESFQPAPKVDSAVVHLKPIAPEDRADVDPVLLRKVCTQGFSMRRKTLRNNFKDILTSEDFEKLGINASARPETLSIDEFIRITQHIRQFTQ